MDAGAEEAPCKAPNIAAAPSRFALMSGTQLSHRAFVIVLVSRSRASLGVALSTCQLSLLAVALWMGLPTVGGGVSKARGAEEPLGSGTMARSAVGPSQVLKLLWRGLPTDVKQYYCGWGSPQVFERLLGMSVPSVVRENTVDECTHSFINRRPAQRNTCL